MRRRPWVVILAVFFVSTFWVVDRARAEFVDGNDLAKWAYDVDKMNEGTSKGDVDVFMNAMRFSAYAEGVHDSLQSSSEFCEPKSGLAIRQLTGVVMKYIKANPEKWNLPGWILVLSALKEAFPCPKK